MDGEAAPPTETDRLAGELRLRVRQLAAVVEVGNRGLSGVPLDSLLEDTVSLVASTLAVELAAIFQLRTSQHELVLRAGVGWPPGLVGSYRQDAGRETQSGYTLVAGVPVIVADRAAETRFSGPSLYHELGLRSGLSVVVGAGDGPWGVLSVHTRRPRAFSDDDVSFLQSVANVLGVALQRRTTEAALVESRQRLDLALGAGGLGTWEWDGASDTLMWSPLLEQVYGLEAGSFAGTVDALLALAVPEDREGLLASFHRGREQGEFRFVHRTVRPDGELRWIEGRGLRLPAVNGGGAGDDDPDDGTGPGRGRFTGVAADVTDRRQLDEFRTRLLEREHAARLAAEAAGERLAFLAEASAALARTLDARSAVHTLVRLLVPRWCDWCVVDVIDEAGRLQAAAIGHADPAKVDAVRELRRRRLAAGGPGLWSVRRTVATGRAELTFVTADEADAAAVDDEHRAVLRLLSPRSAITVPLVARDRILGGLTMVAASEERAFGPDALSLAEDVAARAAIALDNARLFEDRTRVARTLQQSLLPPAIPRIAGLEVVARYRPAGTGADLGGDFYDLFETGDGTWAVVIGDVCGKGTAAAALTGLVRHTLRAAAVREHLPSRVLALTNDAMLDQIEEARFCTAAFLRLVPHDRGATIILSCGGHPEPLLLRPSGNVEPVPCRGTLLGVLPEPTLVDHTIELINGDTLVLYTDGVTEARRDGEIFGDERFYAVLRSAAGQRAAPIAERIEEAVATFQGGGPPSDDIAILVIQPTASP